MRAVCFELLFSTMITMVLVVTGLWWMVRLLSVVLVLVIARIIFGTLIPAVPRLESHLRLARTR
jgi:hypothetical protein